ncbi:MAG: antitoxin [Beijerinckiaceae bacterium]
MTKTKPRDTAKLFMHGRSQAVRLPKAFRMPGTEVRVSKVGETIVLEPLRKAQTPEERAAFWAMLHDMGSEDFMVNGREQPPMPDDNDIPSFD